MSDVLLGTIADFPENEGKVLAVGGVEFGVFHVKGRVIAWENQCPHDQGPACQGRLFRRVTENILPDGRSGGLAFTDRQNIVCPWHGYEFNLDTGNCIGDAALRLKRYDVVERQDSLYVVL
jgi:nitrite reductase/ring-hydroxylating ferredoxin subunit